MNTTLSNTLNKSRFSTNSLHKNNENKSVNNISKPYYYRN